MPKPLILTEDVPQDLDSAYHWYEEQNQGLGQEFMRCIDAKLSEVHRNPLHHQIIYGGLIRRALKADFHFPSILSMKKSSQPFLPYFIKKRSPE